MSSSNRAHQNPPKPDAMTTAPRSEEEAGVRLDAPLNTTSPAKIQEMRKAGDRSDGRFSAKNNHAAATVMAHSKPENELTRWPGTRTK